MKKIFRLTIFKKIFMALLVGFIAVNALHAYMDYRFTVDRVKDSLWHFDNVFENEFMNLSLKYTQNYTELDNKEFDEMIIDFRNKYDLSNNIMLLDKDLNVVKDYTMHEKFSMIADFVNASGQFVTFETSYNLVSDQTIKEINEYIMKASSKTKGRPYIPVEYLFDEEDNLCYLKIGDSIVFDYGIEGTVNTTLLDNYESYDLGYAWYEIPHMYIDPVVSYKQIREDVLKDAKEYNIYTASDGTHMGLWGYVSKFVKNDNIYNYRLYPILKSGIDYNEDMKYSNQDIEGYLLVYNYTDAGVPKIIYDVIYTKIPVYIETILVALVLCFVISYMLSRRIKKIDKTMLNISESSFDVFINDKSKDEIGTLSKNINIMSAKIKDTIGELNNELEHVKKLEGMKSEFIANFTHEIKTPLSIINGYIELIDECKDDFKKKEYLLAINKETDHINHLVLSMLNLSRLQSHNIKLNIEEIDIDELVTSTIDSFDLLIKKKNIKVVVESDSSKILGDYKELTTVMNNFISNAIKYTVAQGSIIIKVKDCILSIENEGSHIEEKDKDKIWDTYVSSDREGTGLGLAINKAILDLHDFKYNVYNTKIGVCFEVKCKRGG